MVGKKFSNYLVVCNICVRVRVCMHVVVSHFDLLTLLTVKLVVIMMYLDAC